MLLDTTPIIKAKVLIINHQVLPIMSLGKNIDTLILLSCPGTNPRQLQWPTEDNKGFSKDVSPCLEEALRTETWQQTGIEVDSCSWHWNCLFATSHKWYLKTCCLGNKIYVLLC